MCIVAESVVDGMDLSMYSGGEMDLIMTHQSIMVSLDGQQESVTGVLNRQVWSVKCRVYFTPQDQVEDTTTPGRGH